MKTIKIIKTPPGQAPEHIRDQWVGVEILTQNEKDDGTGLRDGVENIGGYKVSPTDAINALKKAGKKEAADYWWKEHNLGAISLIFRSDCCEEV